MKHKLLTSIILTFTLLSTSAQFPAIRNFGPQDYNGGTQNWMVDVTPSHYVFVANNNGLMVNTGIDWDIVAIPNNTSVHAVKFNAADNRFYVGAFEEFGYFENTTPMRRACYHSLSARLPQSINKFHDIWDIVALPDDNILFQSNYRIFIYSPRKNTIRTYTFNEKITNVSTVGKTTYVSTEKHIFRYVGKRFVCIKGSGSIASKRISGIYSADPNNIIFVSREQGLYRYDGHTFTPYTDTGLTNSLDGKKIFCVSDNTTWLAFGTIGDGLIALEKKTGDLHHLDRSNGLRNNTVLNIHIDSENNMWAALDNGLSYIIFDSPFRTLFTDANTPGTGYASLPYGNRLYIGTNQGLYHIALPGDYSNHEFTPVEITGAGTQIWTLTEFDGLILCGADAGAFTISGNKALPIAGMDGTWCFRRHPRRPDLILASVYNGVALLRQEGKTIKFLHNIQGVNESTINFEVDRNGDIWYSHWLKGVYRLQLDKNLNRVVKTTFYNGVNQLPGDDNNLVVLIDGQIYISTPKGFFKPDVKSGKLCRTEWLDRLFPTQNTATRIIPTPEGNLWAYRPDYLAYATKHGNSYKLKVFHYASSVKSLQMNLGNISFLPDGRTIMNQNEGYYVVDPNVTIPTRRSVSFDFVRPISSSQNQKETFIYRQENSNRYFETGHDNNSLYFEYSSPQYRDNQAILFSTMVEGYEKEWTQYSTVNHRELTQMPPGEYTIHVRALDTITGEISQDTLNFRIVPKWYETWWARTIFIILIAIVFYAVVNSIISHIKGILEHRKIAEEQKRIEREERERLQRQNADMSQSNMQLTQEIKRKSSELADSDIRMQRKDNIVDDIYRRIEEIVRDSESGDKERLTAELRTLLRSIRHHNIQDANWGRLEDNFNIVFDDLLKHLMKKYPGLTRNDIKLCSYLRLNLSTKEIADLMNLSERSVESSRYRLRKKLAMASGQSFHDFFNSITTDE